MWSWGKIWTELGNVVKKSKETGIINGGFFYILHGEYLSKNIVVVVQTPEWKFTVNIARNTTFEGGLGESFAQFGSKMAKTYYL